MDNALAISNIRLDGGTQMRAGISDETVKMYAEHLTDGSEFPPVIVFYDGSDYWLADGFHRVSAYGMAGIDVVPADIRSGDKMDAVRFALKANATNGRPRTSDDMRRGYQVICLNDLCKASDTKSVQQLLGCSSRWAQELTRAARQEEKQLRDGRITELADQGKSQREIAGEVGVDVATVNRSVAKKNTSEMQHPGPKRNTSEMEKPEPPTQPQPVKEEAPQSRGVGVRMAHEAIAVLKRIPLSDGLRQDAFEMVQDWIKTNRSN